MLQGTLFHRQLQLVASRFLMNEIRDDIVLVFYLSICLSISLSLSLSLSLCLPETPEPSGLQFRSSVQLFPLQLCFEERSSGEDVMKQCTGWSGVHKCIRNHTHNFTNSRNLWNICKCIIEKFFMNSFCLYYFLSNMLRKLIFELYLYFQMKILT